MATQALESDHGSTKPALLFVSALLLLAAILTFSSLHQHNIKRIRKRYARLRTRLEELQNRLRRIEQLEMNNRNNQRLLRQFNYMEQHPAQLATILSQLAYATPADIQFSRVEYLHTPLRSPHSELPVYESLITIDGTSFTQSPEHSVFRLHRTLSTSPAWKKLLQSTKYTLPETHETLIGEEQSHPDNQLPFRILATSSHTRHTETPEDETFGLYSSPRPPERSLGSELMMQAIKERKNMQKN